MSFLRKIPAGVLLTTACGADAISGHSGRGLSGPVWLGVESDARPFSFGCGLTKTRWPAWLPDCVAPVHNAGQHAPLNPQHQPRPPMKNPRRTRARRGFPTITPTHKPPSSSPGDFGHRWLCRVRNVRFGVVMPIIAVPVVRFLWKMRVMMLIALAAVSIYTVAIRCVTERVVSGRVSVLPGLFIALAEMADRRPA
jgi:hypothetical protein